MRSRYYSPGDYFDLANTYRTTGAAQIHIDEVPDILAFMSQPSVARIGREIEATESGVRKSIEMENACEPFEQNIWFSLAVTQSLEQAQSAAAPAFIGSSPL